MHEESGRVIALAVAVWAAFVALASVEGAFARFEGPSIAVFAALVSLYALVALRMDEGLRAYVSNARPDITRALAGAAAVALAIALMERWAPFATFAAPLAALGFGAAAPTFRARATPASSAKSPGARPAAT